MATSQLRVLHKRLTNSKHKMKTELCTCLSEMNDISPDEMCNDSDDWMNLIDRGGPRHITSMVYMFFVSVELLIRKHLWGQEQPSLSGVKEKIIEDEDVQLYWSNISFDWEEEASTLLMNMVIDTWITRP